VAPAGRTGTRAGSRSAARDLTQDFDARNTRFVNRSKIRAYLKSAGFRVTGAPPDAGNVRVDFADEVDASRGPLYSVRTFDQDSSLAVTAGYDQVTGVGIPNTGWLSALR
jgi:hypothetical protein